MYLRMMLARLRSTLVDFVEPVPPIGETPEWVKQLTDSYQATRDAGSRPVCSVGCGRCTQAGQQGYCPCEDQ